MSSTGMLTALAIAGVAIVVARYGELESDLVPYLALFVVGFFVAGSGEAAGSSLAVAVGITIVMAAIALFAFGTGFSGPNWPF